MSPRNLDNQSKEDLGMDDNILGHHLGNVQLDMQSSHKFLKKKMKQEAHNIAQEDNSHSRIFLLLPQNHQTQMNNYPSKNYLCINIYQLGREIHIDLSHDQSKDERMLLYKLLLFL